MDVFRRGIRNPKFLDALTALAGRDSWWRDVLDDTSLIIAVREEALNVYWQGQSIFLIKMVGKEVCAKTHPKYLINPDAERLVSLRDNKFDLKKKEGALITREYSGKETLARLKRAASAYSGEEKRGVHVIARQNFSVIDVEIAVSTRGAGAHDEGDIPGTQGAGEKIPRMDIATFEPGNGGVDVVFWEAKTFFNPEVGSASIAKQVDRYRKTIVKYQDQIKSSYKTVATNHLLFHGLSKKRHISDCIASVAKGKADLSVSGDNVGLIIFGYDADQYRGRGKKLREKFEKELDLDRKTRLRFSGSPSKVRI